MRCLKGFGLTVLIAITALTIGNTSTASAEGVTALCKQNESPCSAENRVKEVTLVNKGTIKLLMNFINLLCSSGSMKAEVLGPGEPQQLHVTEFNLWNCGLTAAHEGCEIEIEKPLVSLPFTLLHVSSNLGVLDAGEGAIHLNCSPAFPLEGFACSFDTENLELDFVGAVHEKVNGMVTATEGSLPTTEGALHCGNEAFLDASLEPLEPVYVTD